MRRIRAAIFSGILFLSAQTSQAQAILYVPGKRIEVVGLRRWTIPMIQDSLQKYAAGVTLDSHACAAALRYRLGFADASATRFGAWPKDSVESIFIAVVEPGDSARVRYRPSPSDTSRYRSDWEPVARLVDRNMGALNFLLGEISASRAGRSPASVPRSFDTTVVRAAKDFLANHAKPSDLKSAVEVLKKDQNDRDRILAAAILANFTSSDAGLLALVEASRENDGRVKQVASTVLSNFTQDEPRRVDWRPASDGLHAILNGTSLFNAQTIMDLLVASKVDRKLAPALLRHGGQTVLDFLGAQHQWPRTSAHKLLMALSGEDFGYDVARWKKWIEIL